MCIIERTGKKLYRCLLEESAGAAADAADE